MRSLLLQTSNRKRTTLRPIPEHLEARECPSGGLLDPTFNGGAPMTSGLMDYASATAIQSDGKMVVVGRQGTGPYSFELAVARFNPDGSPDSSFGSGGVTYSSLADSAGSGVVLQPDGKILVCGNVNLKTKGVTSNAYLVTRYNANGTLDTSFAKSGVFTWDYSTGNDDANRMVLLSDGSILVAGGARGNLSGGSSASVFKLSSTGSLVTSFGTNGLFLVNPGGAGSGAYALALAPNGDLILAGGTHLNTSGGLTDAALLVAVTPGGKLDTGFNGTGYLATEAPGYNVLNFTGVAVQGSDIVVCGGPTGNQLQGGMGGLLARYTLSGALDTTFGTSGYYTTGNAFSFNTLALEPDGSLVAGGIQTYIASDGSTQNEMAFAHLTASGAVDTSFGTIGTGFVYVQAGPQSEVTDLVITSDGRIFAVGYGYTTQRVASLVRFTAP
jgi:uncharacterized delta-60 repeat protein